MREFIFPDLGEGIHEAEIVKWHVSIGQTVKEDAPLVDVETDKATVTIPSPFGGVVSWQAGQRGEPVFVGKVLAIIQDNGQVPSATPSPDPARANSDAPAHATGPRAPTGGHAGARPAGKDPAVTPSSSTGQPTGDAVVSTGSRGPVPAAPATRRLARELGVDLRSVPGSGPGGRVTPEDVQRAHEAPASAPACASAPAPASAPPTGSAAGMGLPLELSSAAREDQPDQADVPSLPRVIPFLDLEPLPDFGRWGPIEKEPLLSIRRKVAHRMVTSKTLVPHVAHMDEADVTALDQLRRVERERRRDQPGGSLTLLAFVLRAVVASLKRWPVFNASLDPFAEEIIYKKYFNLGIAVETERGLIVPVIRDVDRKSLVQLAADIEDVAHRARGNTLTVADLQGGCFTVTNIGALGGTGLIPAINYPEVAILGMGRAQEKPVVREGQIIVRTMLPLTLAFDHRVADGADAARFMAHLMRLLSDPNALFLEV